tara:strand:- start:328 stop:525 length:198 start_codon:yes stop_codon:yes gene_type:complete
MTTPIHACFIGTSQTSEAIFAAAFSRHGIAGAVQFSRTSIGTFFNFNFTTIAFPAMVTITNSYVA